MADISIISPTEVLGRRYPAAHTNGPVWTSSSVGYFFYIREGTNNQLFYKKTTDGGETWGSEVTVTSAAGNAFSIWFDKWTNGDTGDLIHITTDNTFAAIGYSNLDTTTDTLSTEIEVVDLSASHSGDWNSKHLTITKARGGNLYIGAAAQAGNTFVQSFERSTDGGATWADRAQLVETNNSTPVDYAIILPGNESDNQDVWAAYWDVSADELSLKVYDDSANTWAETSIATSMVEQTSGQLYQMAATTRHSDNHILVTAWSAFDDAAADLRIWDINGSGSITEQTNVLTNADTTYCVGIMMDQMNGNIYVGYLGDSSETSLVSVNIRYRRSTDGGVTWETAVLYNEDGASDLRAVWCPLSVGAEGGRFMLAWPDQTATASFDTNFVNSIEFGTQSATSLSTEIIVDWNNDGSFDSTENITGDIISLNWNRGKEPEQETTPVGTAVIIVNDPLGNYAPNSTFFGSSNVDINREVRARTVHQGITYPLFRGRISRIQPNVRPGNVQTATLFIADEKSVLGKNTISFPNNSASTGGVNPANDQPAEGQTFGTTGTSVIGDILDESSIATARRQLSEGGSTAEAWWTFGTSAKAALDEVERHEGKTAMLFVNSSGSIEFHSSTHRNGSTFIAAFGTGTNSEIPYQGIQFELSDRNVLNSADVTIITRITQEITIQEIPEPNVAVGQGSTYSWIVTLDKAPVSSVGPTPEALADSTAGVSIQGASGTTYVAASGSSDIFQTAILGGGSAVRFIVANNTTETVTVNSPTAAGFSGTTQTFPLRVQLHNLANIDRESCDPASITRYGRLSRSIKLPFFGSVDPGLTTGTNNAGKASDRATAEIAHNSTAHPNGVSLNLSGSDSNSLTQILSRDMNDRIRVNSTATLRLSNQDFYITRGEWSIDPGGLMGVVWTLQEAT